MVYNVHGLIPMAYNVPGFPDGRRTARLSLLLVIQGASSEVCRNYNVPGTPYGRRANRISLPLVIQGASSEVCH